MRGTMKRLLVVTVAALSLVAIQARASVTLDIGAVDLLDQNGNLAPLNTVGLFVVDTTGAGFSLPTSIASGTSIAVGSFFAGTNLKIMADDDINNATATPGWLGLDFLGRYAGNVIGWGEVWDHLAARADLGRHYSRSWACWHIQRRSWHVQHGMGSAAGWECCLIRHDDCVGVR